MHGRSFMNHASVAGPAEEQELEEKVERLCMKRYGAVNPTTMQKLFESYDKNGDTLLDKSELEMLLADAGIGWPWTRGFWVDEIFKALDKSPTDNRLSWEEYLAASSAKKKTAGPAAPPPPATPGSVQAPDPQLSGTMPAWDGESASGGVDKKLVVGGVAALAALFFLA